MASHDAPIVFTVSVADLEGRWRRLAGPGPVASRWWSELHQRHSEPRRHYHTLTHLAELLSWLDSQYGEAIATARRPLVEYAIFFHDAVYDPKSATNEADSAALWRQYAPEAGLSAAMTKTVSDWIEWTKAHAAPTGTPEDALLFLDFDMAVLAKPWNDYYTYAAQVRCEYEHVPESAYVTGRPAYFERQLADSAHTFYLSRGLAHLESRARANLEQEVALLRRGDVPTLPPPTDASGGVPAHRRDTEDDCEVVPSRWGRLLQPRLGSETPEAATVAIAAAALLGVAVLIAMLRIYRGGGGAGSTAHRSALKR